VNEKALQLIELGLHPVLLITANGRAWYSFSEETGGCLAELIAWHQALVGEGTC